MPKNDTDGLEQYYNYSVRDDSEIEKKLKYKRNDKISTVAVYVSFISLASGVITGILAGCLNSKLFSIIALISFVITQILLSGISILYIHYVIISYAEMR